MVLPLDLAGRDGDLPEGIRNSDAAMLQQEAVYPQFGNYYTINHITQLIPRNSFVH